MAPARAGGLVSAGVAFFVVDREAVPELVAAADPQSGTGLLDVAYAVGRDLNAEDGNEVFPWSGYWFAFLMEFLASRGVYTGSVYEKAEELVSSGVGVGAYLLTPESFTDLGLLDPDQYDEADIHAYLGELDMDFEEAGMAAEDCIAGLGKHVGELQAHQVLLVLIG